jgi:hypothetical protein
MSDLKMKAIKVPPDVLSAIKRVIEYGFDDEERHYGDDRTQEDHIFPSFKKVQEWFDQIKHRSRGGIRAKMMKE